MKQFISISNYVKSRRALDYIRDDVLYKTGIDLQAGHRLTNLDEILDFIQEAFLKEAEKILMYPFKCKSLSDIDKIHQAAALEGKITFFCDELNRPRKSFDTFIKLKELNLVALKQYVDFMNDIAGAPCWSDANIIKTISKDAIQRYINFGKEDRELLEILKSTIGHFSDVEQEELINLITALPENEIIEYMSKQDVIVNVPDWVADKGQLLWDATKAIKSLFSDTLTEEYLKALYKAIVTINPLEQLNHPEDPPSYAGKEYLFVANSSIEIPQSERKEFFIKVAGVKRKYLSELQKLKPVQIKQLLQMDSWLFSKSFEKIKSLKSLSKFTHKRFDDFELENWELIIKYSRLENWEHELYKEYFVLNEMNDDVVRQYNYLRNFEIDDVTAFLKIEERGLSEQFKELSKIVLSDALVTECSSERINFDVNGLKDDCDKNQMVITCKSEIYVNCEELCRRNHFDDFYKDDILLDAYYTLKYQHASDSPRKENEENVRSVLDLILNNDKFKPPINLELNVKDRMAFAESLQKLVWEFYDLLPWKNDKRRSGDVSLKFMRIINDIKNVDLESYYLVEKTMGVNLAIVLTEYLKKEDLEDPIIHNIITGLKKIPNLFGRIFLFETLYNCEKEEKKKLLRDSLERIATTVEGYACTSEKYNMMVKSLIYLLNSCYESKECMIQFLEMKLEMNCQKGFINKRFSEYVNASLNGRVKDKPRERKPFVNIFEIINK